MRDITKLYKKLKEDGMKQANINNDEAALKYFSWAAKIAWDNNPSVFNDKDIDFMLYELGARRGILHRRKPNEDKIRIGYICSAFHDTGGLSQVIENFLKYQNKDNFEIYVYSTEATRDSDLSGKRRIEIYQQLAKRCYKPNYSDSFKVKAEQLKENILKDRIDIGVFFLLPNDVIAHYILPQLGLPLSIFFHASSHVFCLGNNLYDLHIDFNRIRHERCLQEVQHPGSILINQPGRISLSEMTSNNLKKITKEQIGFKKDCILTATCGGAHKIFWDNTHEYIDILKKILRKYDNVSHLLIGPGMQKVKSSILENANNLSPRVKVLDYVKNPVEIYWDADIFLDTHPLGGALSSFDAIAAGLPVVTGPTLEFLLKDNRTIARDSKEYFMIASKLIEDEKFRIEIGTKLQSIYGNEYDPEFLVPKYESLFIKELNSFPEKIKNKKSETNYGHSKSCPMTISEKRTSLVKHLLKEIISDNNLNVLQKFKYYKISRHYR